MLIRANADLRFERASRCSGYLEKVKSRPTNDRDSSAVWSFGAADEGAFVVAIRTAGSDAELTSLTPSENAYEIFFSGRMRPEAEHNRVFRLDWAEDALLCRLAPPPRMSVILE